MSSLVKTTIITASALAFLGFGAAAHARSAPHDPRPNGAFNHNLSAWSDAHTSSIKKLVERLQQAAIGRHSER
ncbi:hypothetical protein ACQP1W_24120 [Spirillospora sp. CA-255316]